MGTSAWRMRRQARSSWSDISTAEEYAHAPWPPKAEFSLRIHPARHSGCVSGCGPGEPDLGPHNPPPLPSIERLLAPVQPRRLPAGLTMRSRSRAKPSPCAPDREAATLLQRPVFSSRRVLFWELTRESLPTLRCGGFASRYV